MKISNKGFTLVELAIVLVIIGLLVAGLLAGQDLIEQAKINNLISAISGYDRAMVTFYNKYEAIPGDMANASNFGLDKDPSENSNTAASFGTSGDGNGDGDLSTELGAGDCSAYSGEIANFWVHLSNAQLIKGSFSQTDGCSSDDGCGMEPDINFPSASIGTGVLALTNLNSGIAPATGSHFVTGLGTMKTFLDAQDGARAPDSAFGKTLTPFEAYSIDSKIDDGKPGIGKVSSSLFIQSNCAMKPLGDANCMTGSTDGVYNLSYKDAACTIAIKASL